MRNSRFTDEQIVAIPRVKPEGGSARDGRGHDGGCGASARGERADDLHVAERFGTLTAERRASAAAAGERAAEEAGGGARSGDRGDEGDCRKNW